MKTPRTLRISLFTLLATMLLSAGVLANPSSHGGQGGMMAGMHHGAHHSGMQWKQMLTDEQRVKIDGMHLEFMKKKYPLKDKKKALKTELALLVAQDSPNQRAINKKIDELIALKRQLMQLRYDHKLKVRKVLDAQQRVHFDTALLKKAQHGKRGGRH